MTIVIAVMLSAFNALSLSPALAAILVEAKRKMKTAGRSASFTAGSIAGLKRRRMVTSKLPVCSFATAFLP